MRLQPSIRLELSLIHFDRSEGQAISQGFPLINALITRYQYYELVGSMPWAANENEEAKHWLGCLFPD